MPRLRGTWCARSRGYAARPRGALRPTEGAVTQGELTLDQILFMRPVAGWGRHAMPIAGCISAAPGTHPGPECSAAPGWLAAKRLWLAASDPQMRSGRRGDQLDDHVSTHRHDLSAGRPDAAAASTTRRRTILAEERERIFARQWNCVGRASAARASRATTSCATIAGESLIVLRDARGDAARVLQRLPPSRHAALRGRSRAGSRETIQCPYHAWTYRTDGRLIGAPHMQEVEGFDKRDYPLHAAALAEWEGFLFVNVATRAGAVRRRGRADDRPLRALRARRPRRRPPRQLRRARELEARVPELLRVPALPDDPPGAAAVLPVPERRERPDRGSVPRRLHGDQAAERERDDERARACGGSCSRDVADGRPAARVLLLADAEPAAQHPSRLRELLPA